MLQKTYLIILCLCCLQRSHGADAYGTATAPRPLAPLPGVYAGRGEQQQPGRPGRKSPRPLEATRPLSPALPALATAPASAAPPLAALPRGEVQPLPATPKEIAAHGIFTLNVQPKLSELNFR